MKKALRAAFPITVPVMLGYISVGIAFGLVLQKSGYGLQWAFLMSLTVYAGSMQFVGINLLKGSFGIIEIALMTLFVNARQIFYGLSFIERFRSMGKKKWYMIFSLTDETYSLLCASKAPEGVNENQFIFSISLLNQIYWILGSVIGSAAGALITFNTRGIDFAMTALFVVIFIEQWYAYKTHIPALLGIFCTLGALLLFGPNNLILPAMVFISLSLTAMRNVVEIKVKLVEEGEVV